jgi:Tfp pilus assembly protein PilO
MNSRERILAAAVGALLVGVLVYLGVNKLVLQRATEMDARADELEQSLKRLKAENAKENAYRARLKELATETFGADELRASEEVRSHLAELLHQSGLGMDTLSLQPVAGRRVAGMYREIGWIVRSHGKLEQVVNFAFLLQTDPYLHRMENLILSPIARSGDVDIQVKYATLVLENAEAKKLMAERPPEGFVTLAVDSPQRRPYDVITARDLFRPYIPRRGTPGETRSDSGRTAQATDNSPEGRLRVVGLPSWGNQQEVCVRNTSTGEVHTYKLGDEFGGGSIVMIDYRMMPLPDKPEILSGSRVILQVGSDFWAVDLGCSLAQKHRLGASELPAQLKPLLPDTPGPTGPSSQASRPAESTSASAGSTPK